jgi:hypothetical protein
VTGSRLWFLAAFLSFSAPALAPAQVTVRGERREIGQTTLRADEVREMPGAFGDAFRAVEALPGVTPTMSGFPYFFVRGAPPNNNGYFVDGVRVPLLFHIALGPSVIHPGLLERVDFYPGAPPARFGGVAGAVIAGRTREPATEAHGEANLRLVDAGTLLEAPFADGRASALVAGRFGYPGPILSAFSDVRLGYWDYQSRLAWRAGPRDTLSVFGFGSHDLLAHEGGHEDIEDDQVVEDLVSDFHRIDLRYDRALDDGQIRLAGTLGYDSQGADGTYLRDHSAALRLEYEQQLARGVRLRAALDGALDDYSVRHSTPVDPETGGTPSNAEPPRTNLTAGAGLDVVLRPARGVELVPGVRVSVFDSAHARARDTLVAVDPRLSARTLLARGVAAVSSLGLVHQYPALRVGALPAPVVTAPGFPEGTRELQRVFQASQGLEVALPWEFLVTGTGFLSRSSGLTDLTGSCQQLEPPTAPPGADPREDAPFYCPSNEPVEGHAYGFELSLRRPLTEGVSAWLSYTLSRSVRETHFLRLDGTTATETVPSDFDRTHLLNAIFAFDLGRNWRAGSRFVFYTGSPYSELSGNVPTPPYNSHRHPAFYRVDVRLEKRWRFAEGRSVAFVLEGQNVTLSKEANTLGMDCEGVTTREGSTTACDHREVGPITLPSLGVEAFF